MSIIKRIFESYTYAKYRARKSGKHEFIIEYFRRHGITIGNNCHIYSRIGTPEPYLLTIGDNVTISTDVHFITHDNSICKVLPEFTDVFGKINIGDNCFIGANSIILPGVTLMPNTIVAAGSVVTKSFKGNVVVGGNLAKVITDMVTYRNKVKPYAISTNGLTFKEKKDLLLTTNKLIIK